MISGLWSDRGSFDVNDTHFGGASGVNNTVLGFVTAEDIIAIGRCATALSAGIVYKSIKVYRKN